jgi:hypothetical protein
MMVGAAVGADVIVAVATGVCVVPGAQEERTRANQISQTNDAFIAPNPEADWRTNGHATLWYVAPRVHIQTDTLDLTLLYSSISASQTFGSTNSDEEMMGRNAGALRPIHGLRTRHDRSGGLSFRA